MEVFDIDQKLDAIIQWYDLDEAYPNYRKKLAAERRIRSLVASWGTGLRIACIVAYDSERHYLQHWMSAGQQVDFYLCSRQEKLNYDVRHALHFERLEPLLEKSYDRVYLMTRHGMYFIGTWLRQHQVRYQSLYDIFALEHLYFASDWDEMMLDDEAEYWSYRDSDKPLKKYIPMEAYDAYQRMLGAEEDSALFAVYVKRLFFLSLYQRDFCTAGDCIARVRQLPLEQQQAYARQLEAWRAIEDLLREMRQRLAARTAEDVFWLWTDFVPYEHIGDIPFLSDVREKGISFDRIYTMCPNTNPTLKLLLCGKKPVDDDTYAIRHITDDNSPVFRMAHEKGYRICAIGGHWPAIGNENRTETYHAEYGSVTLRLWDVLRQMLLAAEGEKLFLMLHSLVESHYPYLFATMQDGEVFGRDRKRQRAACAYLDRQYRWYLEFLPEACRKIYMTDHGEGSFSRFFHTVLVLVAPETVPRHISSLASYQDFWKILRMWMETDDVDEQQISRAYVEVQDLSWYSPGYLELIYANHWPVSNRLFGYHGIITEDRVYLRFAHGEEYVADPAHWVTEPLLVGNPAVEESEVAGLRALVTRRPLPERLAGKLRYPHAVAEDVERAKPRHLVKIRLLNDLVAAQKGDVAIRAGGGRCSHPVYKPDHRKSAENRLLRRCSGGLRLRSAWTSCAGDAGRTSKWHGGSDFLLQISNRTLGRCSGRARPLGDSRSIRFLRRTRLHVP